MTKCEYEGCDSEPEFYDSGDNKVCRDCMEREISEYGANPEDFETIESVDRAIKNQSK